MLAQNTRNSLCGLGPFDFCQCVEGTLAAQAAAQTEPRRSKTSPFGLLGGAPPPSETALRVGKRKRRQAEAVERKAGTEGTQISKARVGIGFWESVSGHWAACGKMREIAGLSLNFIMCSLHDVLFCSTNKRKPLLVTESANKKRTKTQKNSYRTGE